MLCVQFIINFKLTAMNPIRWMSRTVHAGASARELAFYSDNLPNLQGLY